MSICTMFPPPLGYILLQQLTILAPFLRLLTYPRRAIGLNVTCQNAIIIIAINAKRFIPMAHPHVDHGSPLNGSGSGIL